MEACGRIRICISFGSANFFLTVLTLITVSDIRSMASTNPDYKIHKSPRKADILYKPIYLY